MLSTFYAECVGSRPPKSAKRVPVSRGLARVATVGIARLR